MKTDKKSVLVAAAIAGLMAASTAAFAGAAFPGGDSMNKTQQCGMNACKGAGSCKSHHACKSGNDCGGKHACKGAGTATQVKDGQLKTQ
jgi:hypothetical protein